MHRLLVVISALLTAALVVVTMSGCATTYNAQYPLCSVVPSGSMGCSNPSHSGEAS